MEECNTLLKDFNIRVYHFFMLEYRLPTDFPATEALEHLLNSLQMAEYSHNYRNSVS